MKFTLIELNGIFNKLIVRDMGGAAKNYVVYLRFFYVDFEPPKCKIRGWLSG